MSEGVDKPLVSEITVEELKKIADESIVIDVREEYEFIEVRATGVKILPLEQIPDATSSLPKEKQIFIICASGNRSMVACEYLNSKGFDAVNVIGGTIAWNAAGYPVSRGPFEATEVLQ
ncbi:MAG: rhodanese-like domain-containing protein [Acidimicrobiales bacterium]